MSSRLRPLGGAFLAAALALPVIPTAAHADDGKGPGAASGPTARQAAASATLARAEAAFEGPAAGDPSRSATLALRDLRVALGDLPRADRAVARALLARPLGPQTVCSASTCVHYTTVGEDAVASVDNSGNSIPDYVDTVLATVDQVRQTYVDAGYRPPLSDADSPDNGGDGRLDVYLEDLVNEDESLYGYCDSDDPKTQPGSLEPGYDVSAYCALDNDFSVEEFGAPPLDSLRVTVAHEYFHAVQYAYDFLEDGWLMEATATWAEDELYDDVNDNRQYLSAGQLRRPSVSLDTWSGSTHYGNWIFFRRLSERFPAAQGGLPTIVRDIWNRLDGRAGAVDDFSMGAITRVLKARGTTFQREYALFAVANRNSRRAYAEGASYPVAPARAVNVSATRRGSNPAAYAPRMRHLTSATVRYVPRGLTARNWKLKLAFNLDNRVRGSFAAVTTIRRNGTRSTTLVPLNARGDAVMRVPFTTATVAAVEVTLLNTSIRYRNCWDFATPYACGGGTSADDNLRQSVDPIAYR
ncbi:MXAN_6640 family putative metalloprotease [Nocardioides caeni]|uniref:Uncharacterized protein n=1 Tax=Nocardioides caeni TaxID=574700 RepID=A0A4S8NQI9_9ACTN|nr:MXAN_6640 family putative metalloprotease [Nocardioides caeni]THV17764.1 hypothetical protein E9934_04675 [Nocardioides caeni]